jgi:hypothetical protein
MSGGSSYRVPACALMTLVVAVGAHAHGATAPSGLSPLTADELAQVSAAGLPPQTVDGLARQSASALTAEALLQGAWQQEQQAALERQQALAQLRQGSDNLRIATQVMQTVAFTGQLTPLAPVLMPVMAFPFPLAMLPPSQSPKKQ